MNQYEISTGSVSSSVREEVQDKTSSPKQGNVTGLDTAAFWILTVGIFLLPLLFIPFSTLDLSWIKALFLAAVVSVAFFLWIIARLQDGLLSIPKSLLVLAAWVIAIVFFISGIFSPSPAISLGGVAYELGTFASLLVLALLLFLVSVLFQEKRRIITLLLAVLSSFGLLFLFYLARIIFGADTFSFGVFQSTFAGPIGKWNDLALLAGLVTLISLVALEVQTLARYVRVALYTFLVLSLATLVVANFPLAWTILGGLALAVFVYNLLRNQMSRASKTSNSLALPVLPLVVVTISFIFLVAGNSLGGVITEAIGTDNLEVRPSFSSTASIISETLKESPLLGAGPNRFEHQWVRWKPGGINETPFWNIDFRSGSNLALTYVVTTGLLGALALLAFFLLFLYRGVRSFLAAESPQMNYAIFSLFLVSLYLWLTTTFYIPGATLVAFAFVSTGVFVAFLSREGMIRTIRISYDAHDQRTGFFSVLLFVVMLLATAWGGYTVANRALALSFFERGITAFNEQGDLDTASRLLQRATVLQPSDLFFRTHTSAEVARLNRLVNNANLSVESNRTQFQEIFGSAVSAGREAIRLDEENYLNWVALGRIYAVLVPLNVSGAYESAGSSFDEAEALNPTSPALVLERAQLEISRGNLTAAQEITEQALEIKSNYGDAAFLIAQIEISRGNVFSAIRSLESATLVSPNNSGLFFQLGLLRYNVNNFQEAISVLERAVSLSPQFANAKYFLGLAYEKVGRGEDAIRQFEDIERLNPDNEHVKQVLENLRAGNDPLEGTASQPLSQDEPPIEE